MSEIIIGEAGKIDSHSADIKQKSRIHYEFGFFNSK